MTLKFNQTWRYGFISTLALGMLSLGHTVTALAVEEEVGAKPWMIETRVLPLPRGASPELRKSIGSMPQPDVALAKTELPGTEAQWRKLIAERAVARAVSLNVLEKQYDVSIKRDRINGVAVHHVMPNKLNPVHAKRLFIHLHGGAYVFNGGDVSAAEAGQIALSAGIPALSIDYRMPPDHPFPAAIVDVVTVYRYLLEQYPAGALAIGGTSAGGGLALAAIHRFKALELPVVGAIYAGTPWADLTKTGDTLFSNEGIDRVLVTYDGFLGAAARLYASGVDLKDPLISPVYGDFSGFPPTYLVTGTRDMLLSDTARTHRKLRASGVIADLNVYEGMSHAGYGVAPASPESKQVYSELATFLATHLR
jgi:monoterpene epsilon-lactone hydrolase